MSDGPGLLTIRCACGDCGPVTIWADRLILGQFKGEWRYRFTCPHCSLDNVQVCSPRIVELLIREGIEVAGSTITEGEIAMFKENLARPGALEELTR